jgi:hypothetical protein
MHIAEDDGKEGEGLNFGEEVPFTTLELVRLLGRGASSIVQQKRDPATGKNYAMKIINMFDKGKRDQVTHHAMRSGVIMLTQREHGE